MRPTRLALPIAALTCLINSGQAQPPDHSNIAYGPHPQHTMDFYLADSTEPTPVVIFIHGGAFSGGDKADIVKGLIARCLEQKISMVSINYRLSKDADYAFTYSAATPIPPAFQDAIRAVQFVRLHAAEYNIDKPLLAVSGGSAGGGLCLWLALADDQAKPTDPNPLRRESSKPLGAVPLFAQTTYDQEYIRDNMVYDGYRIAWINALFDTTTTELQASASKPMRQAVSPRNQVDASDSAIALFLTRGNETEVTPGMEQGKFVHNVIFYQHLEPKLQEFGVPYEIVLQSEYASGQRPNDVDTDSALFLAKLFENSKQSASYKSKTPNF